MHSLRSDTDTNTMYMTFSGEITVANLSRLERTAVVAARVLDSEFVLVTDITDCTDVTNSAIERIDEVADQLVQFGLARELRVMSEATPTSVRQRFENTGEERAVDVNVLETAEDPSASLTEKASS